ncbi:Uncharacterised protein [Mycobacteroides abscessus subsp. abscessus]|nr:Uncharacterised protein [Mycobacteroides abscessus subsp. abscessus]
MKAFTTPKIKATSTTIPNFSQPDALSGNWKLRPGTIRVATQSATPESADWSRNARMYKILPNSDRLARGVERICGAPPVGDAPSAHPI